MELPRTYVTNKFRTFSAKVKETRRYLNGCCPVCREGNSWNIKTRLFYFLDDDYLFCHNCNRSWFPINWIMEVSNSSYKEIINELKNEDYEVEYANSLEISPQKAYNVPTLPGECVNLRDELQVNYFKNYPIINQIKTYCENRRLFTAINSPKTFFGCLNDKFHGNRLIIPYYNEKGKIESYISRKILNTDTKAKYLLKFGSNKPIFNLSKIDEKFPYIFLFEGQIDSLFVQNGVAISGVHLTTEQEQAIVQNFPFHRLIWVLDNFRKEEKEVVDVIVDKLKKNETVFLYENDFSNYKDLNDFCVEKGQDFIDPALLLNSSFSGEKGLIRMY